MTDRINDEWTKDELIEEFEGAEFQPTYPDEDHWECDFCSKGVPYTKEPNVVTYIADDVINPQHPVYQKALRTGNRPLVPLATYCEECSTDMLLFPCEGFGEVHIRFDLTNERIMKNVEVTDVSQRDDGIPWDPRELSEAITQVSFEERELVATLAGGDHLWGPENVVTFFLSIGGGVDIRELVNWDGSLNGKALGRARRKFKEFREKMQKDGYSRKKFRDHVRGED